ncbi:MAG: hypothetical protein V1838_02120 [Patescibacteria group bacterium]
MKTRKKTSHNYDVSNKEDFWWAVLIIIPLVVVTLAAHYLATVPSVIVSAIIGIIAGSLMLLCYDTASTLLLMFAGLIVLVATPITVHYTPKGTELDKWFTFETLYAGSAIFLTMLIVVLHRQFFRRLPGKLFRDPGC